MNDDALFCIKCLIEDNFFIGGGSQYPDSCPECGGIKCIMYKKLSIFKKRKAKKLFEKMWKEKYDKQ